MPDNNLPSAQPDPEAAPAEFDFTGPLSENPRVKRRSLKPRPAAAVSSGSNATPASPTPAATPASKPAPVTETPAKTQPTTATSKPATAATYNNTTRSKSATTSPTTSPHGTRPATLYYSSSPRQEKETTAPMKPTPTASKTSSTPAPSNAATRPATAVPATTTPATTRPTSVVDYRTNVERQSREQKSVGGILSILVYTLIGLFVVGAALAGYGAYVLSKQIDQQSVTVHDLDVHYAQANLDLSAKLASTLDTLTQAQAQIAREQDLIVKQQETINKLLNATEANEAALRTERSTRAEETASLRARLRDLEYKGPTTQKY